MTPCLKGAVSSPPSVLSSTWQVSMEIHNLKDSGHIMVLMNAMEGLGYRLFHTEESGEDRMSYQLSYIHASCC